MLFNNIYEGRYIKYLFLLIFYFIKRQDIQKYILTGKRIWFMFKFPWRAIFFGYDIRDLSGYEFFPNNSKMFH